MTVLAHLSERASETVGGVVMPTIPAGRVSIRTRRVTAMVRLRVGTAG